MIIKINTADKRENIPISENMLEYLRNEIEILERELKSAKNWADNKQLVPIQNAQKSAEKIKRQLLKIKPGPIFREK